MLAGGGLAGIAWETGLLRGVTEQSPAAARRLLDSDVLVGTSAGSAVAAQISSGRRLEELFDLQLAETSAEIDPGVDIDAITELFLQALRAPVSRGRYSESAPSRWRRAPFPSRCAGR
ncbi:patatin-like phospholipase family protein [Mycobacterium kansasii]|uniref:Patatin-like phospholipase family protein n=1 Tax=Mycobacterium kansasii TaxID=1768 RepID=A0A1V3XNG5_MYCKA|nr:patatin-like phospholipase family protein [Mycobacterium kansasii]